MRPRFLPALVVLVLASGTLAHGQASDPEMAKGIRQAQEGEFEQAIVTLQGAVPRLLERKAPARDVARAHVYLGVAHLGLNDPAAARTSFLEAIRIDPTLKLGSEEYPPRIVRAFEDARLSAPPAPATATSKTAPAPTTAPATAPATPAAPPAATPPATATAKGTTPPTGAKKGGSKLPLVLLGVGAVGGGVALAAGGGGGGSSSSSPEVTPTPPPPGPTGSANLTYSSPPPGATVELSAKPGGVNMSPDIKVDVTYGADVPDPWFEINLWRGPDLCFSTSKAYSERVDSPEHAYKAGTTARYYVWVWIVRQPGCGDFFTTDRLEFFWGRPSASLFVQNLGVGWNFTR